MTRADDTPKDRRRRQGLRLLPAVLLALALAALPGPGPVAHAAETRPGDVLAPGEAGKGAEKSKKDEPKKEEPKRSVDAALVYFGNAQCKWAHPAEIDLDSVYAQIPEYKTIVDEKLTSDDARHAILMSKVSRKFQKALKRAAKDGGYDLVAQVGAVQGVEGVPVITQSVIDAL